MAFEASPRAAFSRASRLRLRRRPAEHARRADRLCRRPGDPRHRELPRQGRPRHLARDAADPDPDAVQSEPGRPGERIPGDGEVITQILHLLGWATARGSTSRGGVTALLRFLDDDQAYAEPDRRRPRGPRRVMSLGAIFLASKLGAPIICVGVGIDRPWRLEAGIGLAIPRPYSRVRMIAGPPRHVPAPPETRGTRTVSALVESPAQLGDRTGRDLGGKRSTSRRRDPRVADRDVAAAAALGPGPRRAVAGGAGTIVAALPHLPAPPNAPSLDEFGKAVATEVTESTE